MSFYDKAKSQKFLSFTLILFTLAIGVLIGTVVQTGAKAAHEQQVAADATPLTVPNSVVVPNEFTKIAKKLGPSVVNISTEYIPKKTVTQNRQPQSRRGGRQAMPQADPNDDGSDDGGMQGFMQRFFGNGGAGGGFQFGEPQDSPSSALGSGVVVDPNGYILTNNHVVEKATKIKVKFNDDATEYPATVIGTDPDTDLAVIHINRHGLVAAKIGNSDTIQVGDWAVAIGSPFGFNATVTVGIVSALARDIPDNDNPGKSFQHFIQTDAAINPGNSGGPLLNINGEVIGINTMIASRSGGNQGIGFAMPMNTAVKVYNSIIKYGHVTRGSIGISFQADDNVDRLKGYGADHGVFVSDVTANGPSEKAGIKVGDIIVSINGKAIRHGQELIDIVADTPVGETLKLGVIRDRVNKNFDVVVGDRVKIFAALYGKAPATPEHTEDATQMKFGMSVQPLTPDMKSEMSLKSNGVVVATVDPDSFAADIGLVRGDVIVELNGQPVGGPADIRRIQGNLKAGDSVAFHVMRQAGGTRGGGEWTSFFPAGKVPDSVQ